jgi:hypothetical protein
MMPKSAAGTFQTPNILIFFSALAPEKKTLR